nr:MAG TPA: hypothetical protein [Caudoviricetes sp.]
MSLSTTISIFVPPFFAIKKAPSFYLSTFELIILFLLIIFFFNL